MICNNISQYHYVEYYLNDIDEAFLQYIKIKEKEYLCFATDKEEPTISIVCDSIDYEEIK